MSIPAPPTRMPRFPQPFTVTLTLDTTRFRDALVRAGAAASRARNSTLRVYAEFGERAVDELTAETLSPHSAIRQRCFEASVSQAIRDLGVTADDLDALRNMMTDPGGHP